MRFYLAMIYTDMLLDLSLVNFHQKLIMTRLSTGSLIYNKINTFTLLNMDPTLDVAIVSGVILSYDARIMVAYWMWVTAQHSYLSQLTTGWIVVSYLHCT